MPTQHQKAVRAYDDTYLLCRDLRHVWQLVGFYWNGDGTLKRTLSCERCGTQRRDNWKRNGERLSSAYSYAEQYQMRAGFDAYEVRREVIHRATIYASEEAMIQQLASEGTPRVRRLRSAS